MLYLDNNAELRDLFREVDGFPNMDWTSSSIRM